MPPKFLEYKSIIDPYILRYLDSRSAPLAAVNHYGPDLIGRIKEIVVRGKTIRGSLVILSYLFTKSEINDDVLKAASAMEILQTALLIHDDIMDHDVSRRGIPTLHIQYKSESLAMCAADALFFMAFELVGSTETDAESLRIIMQLIGREYQNVCVAQMEDVSKHARSQKALLSLHTYKTARYTFAVPLAIGAQLAGMSKTNIDLLMEYGQYTGILFQIRDDRLDNEHTALESYIPKYQRAAAGIIRQLTIPLKYKTILEDIITFVVARTA